MVVGGLEREEVSVSVELKLTQSCLTELEEVTRRKTGVATQERSPSLIVSQAIAQLTLRPTTWQCDTCKAQIERAEDGGLRWFVDRGDQNARGLAIVHRSRPLAMSPARHQLRVVGRASNASTEITCANQGLRAGETVKDVPLAHLVDADGLMMLLQYLLEGSLPREELVIAILRIHLPNYERARPFVPRAIQTGVVVPNLRAGFLWQDELADVVRLMADKSG